jgi:hypothetical protein
MEGVIRELNLDRDAQAIGFRKQWSFEEAPIITVDDGDIGWMLRPTACPMMAATSTCDVSCGVDATDIMNDSTAENVVYF